MAGFLGMNTDAVQGGAQSLRGTGSRLASEWDSKKGAIAAAGGGAGIGADDLALAFNSTYQGPAQEVREAVDKLPGLYSGLGAVGESSARDYLAGDHAGAQGMPR